MTGDSLIPIGALLLVACLIAIVTRRLGLPYIVGLVVAGILIPFLPNAPQLPLSRDLIFEGFLPPLVFEAALQLEWKRFRRELPLTLTLALAGVAIAAGIVAAGMHYLAGWSLIGAAIFGVLIAATDPVSVIASFRELNAEPRLRMVVESESLLNDAVVAVAFAVLAGIAAGGATSFPGAIAEFAWTALVGLGVGIAASAAVLTVVGRTSDPLVEIALTTIAAYGSFLIAERLHGSGVLASLTAGLVIGNVGWSRAISPASRKHVEIAWDFLAFLANSFVFILIGMNTAEQPLQIVGLAVAGIAILLVLAGRAASIYALAPLFARTRLRLSGAYQHILFWGGLRGALALALALAVPASVAERWPIIITAFIVVAFSILVQGLTMPWLVRRLGVCASDSEATPAIAGERAGG